MNYYIFLIYSTSLLLGARFSKKQTLMEFSILCVSWGVPLKSTQAEGRGRKLERAEVKLQPAQKPQQTRVLKEAQKQDRPVGVFSCWIKMAKPLQSLLD